MVVHSESIDRTTDDVLSWIHYLNTNSEIITLWDNFEIKDFKFTIDNNDLEEISINGISFSINSTYWYRRGKAESIYTENNQEFSDLFFKIHRSYIKPINIFLQSRFTANGINKFQDNNMGKLKALIYAKKQGILIPPTIIASKLEDLKKFIKLHGIVITKPTENPVTMYSYKGKKYSLTSPTQLLNSSLLDNMNSPEYFLPSLFQKYIKKYIEIRSFYLKEKFYSMAIFSQSNEKTKIDYRNYDYTYPNRLTPFQLPVQLEQKLTRLMCDLDLESGSFDLIYTPDHEFYFLEVNPIGQVQWLSRNCNYQIEKMIASYLIREDK